MIDSSAEDTCITEDGSLTLKDGETGELYHNRAGAYTEAMANFVEPLNLVLLADREGQLSFLDVCFGLGYNSFALLNELSCLDLRADSIKIVAIEKFQKPLSYIDRVLGDKRFCDLQKQINAQASTLAAGEFGSFVFSLPGKRGILKVFVELVQRDLREMVPSLVSSAAGFFDGIFHDPFSPRRAPELWTIDLFQCYKRLLQPSGRVVTYSSASAVRSAFQQCGMFVRRTTAVGGKSGGTLALLSFSESAANDGFALMEEELEKLAGRAGVPYRDQKFCLSSKEIVHQREQEQRLLFPY